MDAFDSDVLISVATQSDLGRGVKQLFAAAAAQGRPAGIGSVTLIPEVLTKPLRQQAAAEYDALRDILGRLELVSVDEHVNELATALGARYGLRALDAIHLASAVSSGAERFITNNRSDFTTEITEIDIVYPDQLAVE